MAAITRWPLLAIVTALVTAQALVALTPASLPPAAEASLAAPKLHGRFIHLTDAHPDGFYLFNSSESKACHTTSDKSDKDDLAGYWGTAVRQVISWRMSGWRGNNDLLSH